MDAAIWGVPLPVMLLRRMLYYKLQGAGLSTSSPRFAAGFALLSLTQDQALKLILILSAQPAAQFRSLIFARHLKSLSL